LNVERCGAILILTGLAMALTGGAALAGESLSAETVLVPADAGKSEFYPGGKDSYYPGAAFGKDIWLIAWQAGRMNEGDIVACRVDKSGKVLDEKPFVVSAAKDDQERPKTAFGGGVFLVVWQDLRNEKDYDVYAARVTPEGKVLDVDGILISGGAHNQVRPRLAFDGENFVLAWQDARGCIYCARVSTDGKVLEPEGIATKAGATEPAVASSGGGRSLVVMHTGASSVRDGFAGVFLQGGKLAPEKVAPHLPGAKPDFFPSAMTSFRSLAAGKNGYLMAYRNYAPAGRGGTQWDADCFIIHPDGTRGPFQSLTGKPHRAIDPEVVWDGSCYVAAWTDPTPNWGRGDEPHEGIFSRVFASRLDEDGKVLIPPGQPISVAGTSESPAQRAALATDGAGVTLIAYERHPEKGDVPIKIGFRMLTTK
jgi:hypothetical protein